MEKKKILLIDDEQMTVDFVKHRLEQKGYDVVTAFNGFEGLHKVGQENPDLILLDIRMPHMNGYEVLGRLKENPSTKAIPVIILSGNEDVESVVKTMAQGGAIDYVIKPFYIDESLAGSTQPDVQPVVNLTEKISRILNKS